MLAPGVTAQWQYRVTGHLAKVFADGILEGMNVGPGREAYGDSATAVSQHLLPPASPL